MQGRLEKIYVSESTPPTGQEISDKKYEGLDHNIFHLKWMFLIQ